MGKVYKLEKFAQNKASKNVIEPGKDAFEQMAGNWHVHFQNKNPISVELACGWGEYTVSLAERFPDRNFIGVDVKGDRVWKGSQYAIKSNLQNVAFLRIHIIEIDKLFAADEVDEVWLTFPDPRPKDKDEKHRLSNISYLAKYQHILKPDGWFRFKTDNTNLFDYTLGVLENMEIHDLSYTYDLYTSPLNDEHHGIQTKYEKIWTAKGEKVKYLKFKF